MHLRLEFHDEKSHKFWEIQVADSAYTVTYGKIGTSGQDKTKEFSSSEEALAAAEKQLKSKRKKGYAEAGAAPTPEKSSVAKAAKAAPKKNSAPPKSIGEWSVETLARPDSALSYDALQALRPTIAVSPTGGVGVAWCDKNGVFYRFWNGKTWSERQFSDERAAQVRIAFDATGILHVLYDVGATSMNNAPAFHYEGKGQLIYLRMSEDELLTEVVASDLWPGWMMSGLGGLMVDNVGQPHIVYSNDDKGFYATRSDGQWGSESLEFDYPYNANAAAIDASGGLHILTQADFQLQHGYRPQGGEWQLEPIFEKYETNFPSLAVGEDGRVHVAVMGCTKTKDRAKYICKDEQGWSDPMMIEKKGNNGFGNSLRLDADGVPHLVYRIQKSRQSASVTYPDLASLRHATFGAKKWTVDEVVEKSGWHSEMAIAADGTLLILFLEDHKGAIMLARR